MTSITTDLVGLHVALPFTLEGKAVTLAATGSLSTVVSMHLLVTVTTTRKIFSSNKRGGYEVIQLT